MLRRSLPLAPFTLTLALPLLAFATTLTERPPLMAYLTSRLHSLTEQLTVLNQHIGAEQQKQQATLTQTQRLTRQMLSLSRWPQPLMVLSTATEGHVTTPQLLAHVRSQTMRQLTQRQQQLQTLTTLRQQAMAKAADITALRQQLADGGKHLSTDDKIALYAAATSADQLAVGIQNALTPPLTGVASPQVASEPIAENLPTPTPAVSKKAQRGIARLPVSSRPHATTTGLLFAPAPGTVVNAALAGKVLYAGPFRQFGGLVIVETAPHVQHIYAGLGLLNVKANQAVQAGQPLGKLPAQGPVHLYWEVRKNGQPLPAARLLSLN